MNSITDQSRVVGTQFVHKCLSMPVCYGYYKDWFAPHGYTYLFFDSMEGRHNRFTVGSWFCHLCGADLVEEEQCVTTKH